MAVPLSRRDLGVGAVALAAVRTVPAAAMPDALAFLERRSGGRLGVFVLDTGTGRTLAHRADGRFLMCSTFKGILAAFVLSRIDAGHDRLTDLVPYGRNDVIGVSPVTRANLAAGTLTVERLCAAAVRTSDNGAANLLLARAGGPAALTRYVRGLGDPTTRFDRFELDASRRSGTLDTTTPRAIVGTVRSILLGDALRPVSRTLLEGWMVACRTGSTRLCASFPPSWTVGDKTGTGDGECNDYAIIRRPGRAPLLVSAYHDAPGTPVARQEAVLRAVGSIVAEAA